MEKKIKICGGYIINDSYFTEEDTKRHLTNLSSFIYQIDKLFIYITYSNEQISDSQKEFIDKVSSLSHVEIAFVKGFSESELTEELLNKATEEKANFAVIVKPGYFYEEESFNELKKYLITADTSNLAVITPMPLLACEVHERKAEEYRLIKGCRLIGALINVDIYNNGFKIDTSYYQTTFDYDYCLSVRQNGYDVMLAQNQAFRNQNYKLIMKKIGLIHLSMFDRDLMDVYYETRGRLYLWKKYKYLDPEYIKIDKKQFKQEVREMRFKDKHYKEKAIMIAKAKQDFANGVKGIYKENS